MTKLTMIDFEELDELSEFRNVETEWEPYVDKFGFDYISEMIVKLYEEHKSYRKVGKLLDKSHQLINYYIKKWRASERTQDNSQRDGLMSVYEIADELGVCRQRVDVILENAMKHFREKWIEMYGEFEVEQTDLEKFLLMMGRRG